MSPPNEFSILSLQGVTSIEKPINLLKLAYPVSCIMDTSHSYSCIFYISVHLNQQYLTFLCIVLFHYHFLSTNISNIKLGRDSYTFLISPLFVTRTLATNSSKV